MTGQPEGRGHGDGPPETEALELSRSQRRRAQAQRTGEGAPQEGVEIFRSVDQAVLVALHRTGTTTHDVDASLDELELLVDTAGGEVVGRVVQKRDVPDVATFVGRGKVAELKSLASQLGADAAIFDDELSPAQQRNLEERLGIKVLDRNIVILDIFAQHASSREGRAQVELAQLSYLLPRLRGWGKALSQQAGGIGGARRGPGETQLELDRRKLNRRITKLKADLRDFERTRRVKTQERERAAVPTIALVGYTNAGKSTLMNALTGADVLVADQLFATLDTTARRLELPDGRQAVLTDTVGFVRKLPTQLVEAFKSTLEDTLRADLLLHVVDGSAPNAGQQIDAVREVLHEIGAHDVPELLVVNKVDAATPDAVDDLLAAHQGSVAVSAATGAEVDKLRDVLSSRLRALSRIIELAVPYARGDVMAALHREGEVLVEIHGDRETRVRARIPQEDVSRFADFVVG